jgi:hypothetical protein
MQPRAQSCHAAHRTAASGLQRRRSSWVRFAVEIVGFALFDDMIEAAREDDIFFRNIRQDPFLPVPCFFTFSTLQFVLDLDDELCLLSIQALKSLCSKSGW